MCSPEGAWWDFSRRKWLNAISPTFRIRNSPRSATSDCLAKSAFGETLIDVIDRHKRAETKVMDGLKPAPATPWRMGRTCRVCRARSSSGELLSSLFSSRPQEFGLCLPSQMEIA
jgi:hypothetical protein